MVPHTLYVVEENMLFRFLTGFIILYHCELNLARFGFHASNMTFSIQTEEWICIHVNYMYNFACVFFCI